MTLTFMCQIFVGACIHASEIAINFYLFYLIPSACAGSYIGLIFKVSSAGVKFQFFLLLGMFPHRL